MDQRVYPASALHWAEQTYDEEEAKGTLALRYAGCTYLLQEFQESMGVTCVLTIIEKEKHNLTGQVLFYELGDDVVFEFTEDGEKHPLIVWAVSQSTYDLLPDWFTSMFDQEGKHDGT